MQSFLVVLFATLALTVAKPPLPAPKDPQRETSGKVENGILDLHHREKIFENNNHRFDGSAVYRQDLLNKQAPKQLGGRVDYSNKNSRTNVGVEALNAGRFGTQIGVEASRQIFKARDSALEVGGKYGQHFGGPGGRGEPFFGAFIRGRI